MKRVLNVALKTAIFGSGKKQKTVARLARINETKLSHIIRGRRPPSEIERANLAKVLGRPEAELFAEAS